MRKINQIIYPLSLLIAVNTTTLESRLIYSSYSSSLTIAQLTFPNYSLSSYASFKSQLNTLISSLKNNPSQVNNINDFDLLYNDYLSLQKEIATLSPSPELTKALDELGKVLEILKIHHGVNNSSLYQIQNLLSTNWRNDPLKELAVFLENELNIINSQIQKIQILYLYLPVFLLLTAIIFILISFLKNKKKSLNNREATREKRPLPPISPNPFHYIIFWQIISFLQIKKSAIDSLLPDEDKPSNPNKNPNEPLNIVFSSLEDLVAAYNNSASSLLIRTFVNPLTRDVERAGSSSLPVYPIQFSPSHDREGNYIIIYCQDTYYLAPKQDFRPIAPNKLALQCLFDYETPETNYFELIEPAQVIQGDQRNTWKLVQKGRLRFCSNIS